MAVCSWDKTSPTSAQSGLTLLSVEVTGVFWRTADSQGRPELELRPHLSFALLSVEYVLLLDDFTSLRLKVFTFSWQWTLMSLLSACPELGVDCWASSRSVSRLTASSSTGLHDGDLREEVMVAQLLGLLPALSAFVLLFLTVRHPHCSGAFLCCGGQGPSLSLGPGLPLHGLPLVQSLGSGRWASVVVAPGFGAQDQ